MKFPLHLLAFMVLVGCYCTHSIAENIDAELVNMETRIKLEKDKLVKHNYFEIKINNREGDKYSEISIPYSDMVRVKNLTAYLLDYRGQRIRKLKRSEIIDKSHISDYSLYESDFVKEFILKHNTYPYTIVYSFESHYEEYMYLSWWQPVIHNLVPTRNASLEISVPEDYDIDFYTSNVTDPDLRYEERQLIYKWETSYEKIVEKEVLSPPLYEFLPYVIALPKTFLYDRPGSYHSWKEFGNWQYDLFEGLDDLPEREKERVLELIKTRETEKEKIRVLYHYLQDATRYINVRIETGGYKPYPASYVSVNKYGDCKALSNFFRALLNETGIKSYYTLVYAGSPSRKINEQTVYPQFNHVILFIPLENDTLWLDCTSNMAFDYLGTFTQNRKALVIDRERSHFIRTPALNAHEVLESRNIFIEQQIGEKARVYYRNTFKGEGYEELHGVESSYSSAIKSLIIRNYFTAKGQELQEYTIKEGDRDSAYITLEYNTLANNIYQKYGNELVVQNICFDLPELEVPSIRDLPLQIEHPIFKTDTIVYDIPAGYELSVKPKGKNISSIYGNYTLDYEFTDGKIIVQKSVMIHSGYYGNKEYPDFYNFYDRLTELESTNFIILTIKSPSI